ncbi:MAG TPA: FAD/NAD(P)-binding oxidoreductase [Thauera sp.]|uniref:FAD/NAD(P)-binding oxidoreductase n=1 Tax=Thauera sp. TaxID=1905334 RepID=UPI002D0630F8|nr:FAD/NAD(P)-binding oxidoreductase [Thauera sp.]HRV77507.1 FAD/NAD(P)-binding oxidoreductase [Thauera sp.]
MKDLPKSPPELPAIDPERRRLLLGASALPLAAGAGLSLAPTRARAALKTSARIVIAGSGLAGVAAANRLARELDGAKITIVDRKEIHNYQPGYTLVATGVWPVEKVSDRNADLIPPGVEWVREMVAEFDAEKNAVVTDGGRRIEYDFLIVATGLHMDFGLIEGMDVAAIGRNGLASVYPSPQAAQATWQAMDTFRQKGGKALMTLPATPLKCAGAPLKMTFMVVDRLRQAGTRDQSQVSFHSALDNIFSVPRINQEVLERWKKLDVPVHFLSKLVAVDIGARRATFASPEGERTQHDYDFIHVVPPMRAPDSVKNSPLSWKQGPFAAGGTTWMKS